MHGRRTFQWHWAALLVTLAVAALGLRLGYWQLSRADQKQVLLDTIQTRATSPAVPASNLVKQDDPAYYPVEAIGHFDNAHPILLDNRILDGVAGYHLLTPFQATDGQWFLVNRGWLPRGRERDKLPAITALQGLRRLTGSSYVYSEETFTLAEDNLKQNQWPLRLQKIEMHAISEALGVELAPFEIRVTPGFVLEPGEQMPRPWHETSVQRMGPERHHAYAMQWFALAVLAVVVFVAASFRKPEETSGDTL